MIRNRPALAFACLLAPLFVAPAAPSFASPGTDPLELCATRERPAVAPLADSSDCSLTSSNPSPLYDAGGLYTIPVVVHILQDSACVQGALTDQQVASQIAVLNEDFGALAGTPGAAGSDTGIRFVLASKDPNGQPTTGITRHCNTTWFNDQTQVSAYYETLSWDPARYLNLYTSSAANSRGYVPFLPAASPELIGTQADRVVINWQAFGRPGPVAAHADGRTATHEIGHFFGLFHVYYQGCGTTAAPGCYSTGDTLCDTVPDDTSHHGCLVGTNGCPGVPIPAENYMELSDDTCMTGFTREQARRLRCTLTSYRASLTSTVFADGFETGATLRWSLTQP